MLPRLSAGRSASPRRGAIIPARTRVASTQLPRTGVYQEEAKSTLRKLLLPLSAPPAHWVVIAWMSPWVGTNGLSRKSRTPPSATLLLVKVEVTIGRPAVGGRVCWGAPWGLNVSAAELEGVVCGSA